MDKKDLFWFKSKVICLRSFTWISLPFLSITFFLRKAKLVDQKGAIHHWFIHPACTNMNKNDLKNVFFVWQTYIYIYISKPLSLGIFPGYFVLIFPFAFSLCIHRNNFMMNVLWVYNFFSSFFANRYFFLSTLNAFL